MHIKPIHTEKDYERAILRMEKIFDSKRGTDEGDELEILGLLVEQYEQKKFPIDAPSPVEAIKFRMDQLGMGQKDLAKVLGSKSRASEILSGKRQLSLRHIKILIKKLGIPADVLIQEAELVQ